MPGSAAVRVELKRVREAWRQACGCVSSSLTATGEREDVRGEYDVHGHAVEDLEAELAAVEAPRVFFWPLSDGTELGSFCRSPRTFIFFNSSHFLIRFPRKQEQGTQNLNK